MTILIWTNYTSMHSEHDEEENWIWIINEYEYRRLEFRKVILNYNMQMRFLWIPSETLVSPRWYSHESHWPGRSGQYLTVTGVRTSIKKNALIFKKNNGRKNNTKEKKTRWEKTNGSRLRKREETRKFGKKKEGGPSPGSYSSEHEDEGGKREKK